MRKTKRIAALFSAAALTLSTMGFTAVAAEDNSEKTIEQMLSEMTTEQKIEQMTMITLRPWSDENDDGFVNVTSLNDKQRKLIEDHNFAGVCLYAQNIQNTAQTIKLTSEIQQAALNSDCAIPMLISADQEGGIIYRLSTGTPTCGNMAIGATRNPQYAMENAKILGSEIKALGINTNLAPVIDINNNPANPVINVRSFSSDPKLVSEMGVSYINGLKSEGVITTCKHFPGHGDTSTDSHTGLPLINKTYDELKNYELYPYTAAIENGTDMIMTAHIQFPKIEADTYTSKTTGEEVILPATLSKTMITDILRGDYGYDGVVITDSMVMGAIHDNFDLIDAAALAINADVDILLEPVDIVGPESIDKLEEYIEGVAKQVKDGKISEETIDKSVTRILNMKKNRGILDYTAPNLEKAQQTVGSAEHREKALQIAEKAVTLVKNDDDLLPLDLGEDGRIAYFFPYSNVELPMTFALDRLKKEGVISDNVTADCNCYNGHSATEYEENVKNSDVVFIALEMYSAGNLDSTNSRGWQAAFTDDMIELAHKYGKKVVYISANIPYDVARFQKADAVLAAYSANGMDKLPVDGEETPAYGENYPAAIITALGGNSPTGKLPVDIYALDENSHYTDEILYPFGYGLSFKSDEPAPETTASSTTTTTTSTTSASTQPESTAKSESTTKSTTTTSKAATTAAATNSGTSSPKTGSAAPSVAMIALALSASVAVSSRKKK